jgi:tetratricopeptide (TPR) repeat protein
MLSLLLLTAALQAPAEAPAGARSPEKPKAKTASVKVARAGGEAEEPAAAREAARRCEEDESRDAALLACQEALRLGLREPRRGAVRQLLELRLAEAFRFDELVEAYREDCERLPEDAEAWRRLGAALLYFKEDASGARAAFETARTLRPGDVSTLLDLGVCLNALGEHAAATATFDDALRLDPEALGLRPAARAAHDASRRGERWP